MKRLLLLLIIGSAVVGAGALVAFSSPAQLFQKKVVVDTTFHDGDLIFQSSNSGQSHAVQLATHSVYTHCGILFQEEGHWMVYEAVQPVQKVRLEQWTEAGNNGFYIIRRLRNADSVLTAPVVQAMKKAAVNRLGRDYDIYFNWDEERLYCSELVWKVYQEGAGIEVGVRKQLRDYDLTAPAVKKIMKQRYGNKPPLDDYMISPQDVFESPLLITVKQHGSL